ncbi:hypothetical protein [Candidatus Sororendozoicomonas aggregata]|uniref:hypothetical protein n=1 Tax=Candidatus Sororendozoicomonas aggregata TaxID=3073239 RepID=UPI002ED67841
MTFKTASKYPFPKMKGASYLTDEPIRIDSLNTSMRRRFQGEGIQHAVPRDIRRTCKTLMGKAGLSKEIRDRIHNHTPTDVSSNHYDRYDYLTEKREALNRWGDMSHAIIQPGSNACLPQRRAS